MKIVALSFLIALASASVTASDYARVSDRVVLPPASGETSREALERIVVFEVIKVDQNSPERAVPRKPGSPPYVLLDPGEHDLLIERKRALSLPGAKGEIVKVRVSVEAGVTYLIEDTGDGLRLVEWTKGRVL